jgi:putative effector of murein hydrolase LrgA (UPF0299 family)
MTRIVRLVVALGFIWWLIAGTMAAVEPYAGQEIPSGVAGAVLLFYLLATLLWLLVDKVVRVMADIFGARSA